MNKNNLAKLKNIMLFILPFLYLASSAVNILFLCGVIKNESMPYIGFSAAMLVNSIFIILNMLCGKDGADNGTPKLISGKGFLVFDIVSAVMWFVSYVMFVLLK